MSRTRDGYGNPELALNNKTTKDTHAHLIWYCVKIRSCKTMKQIYILYFKYALSCKYTRNVLCLHFVVLLRFSSGKTNNTDF